jgi:hypothetical protein
MVESKKLAAYCSYFLPVGYGERLQVWGLLFTRARGSPIANLATVFNMLPVRQ